MYQSTDLLALYKLCEVALLVHVEDDDRHVALTAERESWLVHDLETILDRLVEAQLLILYGCRVLLRICCLDSVYACSLEESIGSNLKSAESCA